MKLCLGCLVLGVLLFGGKTNPTFPKVQVYSHYPGKYGEKNTLICHISDFYPPEIKIDLLRNGIDMEYAYQTDLAFEQGWQFHLTKSVQFQPQKGDQFECKVTHMGKTMTYVWGESKAELLSHYPRSIAWTRRFKSISGDVDDTSTIYV
ncbi:beta-2-microglobulin-like [Arapaima gigas]